MRSRGVLVLCPNISMFGLVPVVSCLSLSHMVEADPNLNGSHFCKPESLNTEFC